jgi:hypothetical protein
VFADGTFSPAASAAFACAAFASAAFASAAFASAAFASAALAFVASITGAFAGGPSPESGFAAGVAFNSPVGCGSRGGGLVLVERGFARTGGGGGPLETLRALASLPGGGGLDEEEPEAAEDAIGNTPF